MITIRERASRTIGRGRLLHFAMKGFFAIPLMGILRKSAIADSTCNGVYNNRSYTPSSTLIATMDECEYGDDFAAFEDVEVGSYPAGYVSYSGGLDSPCINYDSTSCVVETC
jgi:hypothetical protein